MFSLTEAEATALKSGLGLGFFFSSFGRMEKEGNVQVFRLCSGRRAGWGEVAGKKIIREVRLLIKCGF